MVAIVALLAGKSKLPLFLLALLSGQVSALDVVL